MILFHFRTFIDIGTKRETHTAPLRSFVYIMSLYFGRYHYYIMNVLSFDNVRCYCLYPRKSWYNKVIYISRETLSLMYSNNKLLQAKAYG